MMQDNAAFPSVRLGLVLTALALSACTESPTSAPLSAGEPRFEVFEVTTTSIADERIAANTLRSDEMTDTTSIGMLGARERI